jgi:hypothetical protein
MQAASRKADDNRTIVPVNAERWRKSGWTTSNKIRPPLADWKLHPPPLGSDAQEFARRLCFC